MKDSGRILGVGVIGLGVGEQHARAFHAHPACEVRSLCDLDLERARSLASEFPDCAVAARFEEMLADPRLDVLAIASFDDAHYEQVVAALQAGKHVFVEKPVCRTLGELADVKARWRAEGGRLKLCSNLVLRAAPLYGWLRERIRAGELGQIYAFDGDYLYGRLQKITAGWRKDVSEYSVMEGGGVHLVDLMLWLTGERPVAVTASGNRICTGATAFRYNDFAAATFEFDSGLVGRVTANFGCVHRHHHVMRVFGTQATFLYDDAGPRLHRSRDPALSAEQLAHAPLPAHKGDLVPAFVSAILRNADDSDQTQSVFDGIGVCIAADRAVATGKKERIEYI
jgi:predicted dehydrogenase